LKGRSGKSNNEQQKTTTMKYSTQTKKQVVRTGAALLIGLAVLLPMSCNKASGKLTPKCDGTTPTYTSTVKTIIDDNCISCHSAYSSYSGLNSITSNGQFEKHVLTKQDMPDGGSLSQDQLNKLQCWVENGFPEN